jgi:predicted MFS family arabinose efflux permease
VFLGGVITEWITWPWVFYINLPIALVVLALVPGVMPAVAARRGSIDLVGAVTATAGLALTVFGIVRAPDEGWSSASTLVAITGGVALLALFPFVESRAAEPILPLELFRNQTFRTTSAISFVIGFALFGSVTFLPIYLQIVKGNTPTESGLLLTPMMAGVLVTSTVSGFLISRYGRYRVFPIAGTALATVALYLLSTLEVGTSTGVAAAYMLLLGLGLGMVMQVIVLAAQNAVDYRLLGVATSGSTLFRQVGGSIGVSVFGAIFANRLAGELAQRLPEGVDAPADPSPAVVEQLPPAIHSVYVAAVSVALHPVFLTAAGVMVVGFGLSWLLRDVPLRQTAGAAASVGVDAPREPKTVGEGGA